MCVCVHAGVTDGWLSNLALLQSGWALTSKPEWAQKAFGGAVLIWVLL